jgi:hypothetical protein
VERKVNPLQLDVEILVELFNTPGTEIAPWSHEIGEHFEDDWFIFHVRSMAQIGNFP